MQMDAGLDTGPMVDGVETSRSPPRETAGSLHDKLARRRARGHRRGARAARARRRAPVDAAADGRASPTRPRSSAPMRRSTGRSRPPRSTAQVRAFDPGAGRRTRVARRDGQGLAGRARGDAGRRRRGPCWPCVRRRHRRRLRRRQRCACSTCSRRAASGCRPAPSPRAARSAAAARFDASPLASTALDAATSRRQAALAVRRVLERRDAAGGARRGRRRRARARPRARAGARLRHAAPLGPRSTRSTQALAAQAARGPAAGGARRGRALPARPHATPRPLPSSIARSTPPALSARPQAKRAGQRDAAPLPARARRAERAGRSDEPGRALVVSALVDRPRRGGPSAALGIDPRGRQRAPAADAARQRARRRRASACSRASRPPASPRMPVGAAGIIVAEPRPVTGLPGFAEGAFSVQDARRAARRAAARRRATACACSMPAPRPAARPRISLELADVDLTALDRDAARLARVRENLARLRLAGPATCRASSATRAIPAALVGRASVRPHPRRRAVHGVRHRPPASRRQVAAAQDRHRSASPRSSARILAALWPLLAPGGRLLYVDLLGVRRGKRAADQPTSCTTTPMRCAKPSAFPGRARTQGGQLLPSGNGAGHNQDGFFYALLRKR